MHLDDCYRLLEVERQVSEDELRRAHRDLTKVWHPDRFGHDVALRRRAEEKLKAINEAYETIRASRPEGEEVRTPHARPNVARRNHVYALMCALIAVFVLLRRPSPAGLVIALVLFVLAFVLIARMRA